jgi:hypothetical protein
MTMRRAVWAASMLMGGAVVAQEPAPAPPAPPAAAGPPTAVVPARRPPAEVDLLPPVPLVDRPRVGPAHQVAQVELGQVIPPTDPGVGRAARLLEGATAIYVEDAPTIAALTLQAHGALAGAKRPASPLAILEGALRVPRPAALPPGVPRSYADYAARYRRARVEAGLDHDAAIGQLQAAARPPR